MQQYLRLRKAAVQGYIKTATHRTAVTPIFFPSLLLRLRPRSLQCSSEWFQGQDDQEYWTKFFLELSLGLHWYRVSSYQHHLQNFWRTLQFAWNCCCWILLPRYPHSCLDSGTLVVSLLRKKIINPVFLFSSQAEEWLQVWRQFSRHSRAINSFLTLGSCWTAADPANALALGVQQHLLNLKTFFVILFKSAICVRVCLNSSCWSKAY